MLSMKSGGEKNPKEFGDGKSAELSPNMNENWLLSFSDADLKASIDEPLSGRLIVYSAMGTLPSYQSRVNDIVQTPGIADRILELREAAKLVEKNKKPIKQRKSQEPTQAVPVIVAQVQSPSIPTSGKLAAPGFQAPVSRSAPSSNTTPPTSPLSPPSSPTSGKLAPPPPPGA